MPQLSDTEWKHYRPRHPVAVPASYPRSPPEVVDNPALFRKVGGAGRLKVHILKLREDGGQRVNVVEPRVNVVELP